MVKQSNQFYITLPINHFPYRYDSMVPNTAMQFYGTDSQQLFERNLKYRTNWIYANKEVNYSFNNGNATPIS